MIRAREDHLDTDCNGEFWTLGTIPCLAMDLWGKKPFPNLFLNLLRVMSDFSKCCQILP